ncbi:MAG: hypothetical protein AABY13_06180, partial [Nanoarchaeota archaeon]
DQPITKVTLEIPGDYVRIINVIGQGQVEQKVCTQYTNTCVAYEPQVLCTSYQDGDCVQYERPCREKQNTCVSWENRLGGTGFSKANFVTTALSHSTTVTVDLPSRIDPNGQGTILIYYKAEPYATEMLGRFTYDFETIKVNDDVANVRVAIDVPDEFVLAGAQSTTQYRGSSMMFAAAEKSFAAVSSDELSSFSRSIEYQNGLVKTTQALDPLESFHVKGTYARGTFALYWERILGWSLGVLLVIGAIIMGVRRLSHARTANAPWLASMLSGVGSGVLVSILWFGGYALLQLLSRFGWSRVELALPLLIVAWIALLLGAVFAPPILIGMRKGAVWGFVAFGMMFVCLIIIAVVIALIGIQPSHGGGYVMY